MSFTNCLGFGLRPVS